MRHKNIRSQPVTLVAVLLGVTLLAAGCGNGEPSATGAEQGGATVSVHSIDGAAVLVDAAGQALYTNDQDRPGKLMCTTADCTKIWEPLTVQAAQPTADGVAGKLGTVARADGSRQVTWKGKPLYTFSFDHGPGRISGDGFQDSFGGTTFVWHAAAAKGQPSSGSSAGTGGSGGARYGY